MRYTCSLFHRDELKRQLYLQKIHNILLYILYRFYLMLKHFQSLAS